MRHKPEATANYINGQASDALGSMKNKDEFRLPSRKTEADLSVISASKVQLSAEGLPLKFGLVFSFSHRCPVLHSVHHPPASPFSCIQAAGSNFLHFTPCNQMALLP